MEDTITRQEMRHVQLAETKNMFDELIDRHAEAYQEVYPEVKEFSNFEKSGTGHYYIGMIWTNDFEKPQIESILLRGSSSLTDNSLVELDLSALSTQQSFFPGQIIAFLADPFTKRQLTVRKLLDPMLIAPRMKTISTDEDIRLLIAAGPYMKPEQEDWTLFDKIITSIVDNNATHVILMGPFVDIENKFIRANFDINWRRCTDKLVEGLVNHDCKVYLVPSNRDVLPAHRHATYYYPSPSLNLDLRVNDRVQPKCNIFSVSDPAQIDLGGIYLDVTSAEVLLHLNKCSSFINRDSNALTSLYRHLIAYGIYPIYPSHGEIAIDYPKLAKYNQLDRLGPHILAIPTRFKAYVGDLDDRLLIAIQKCSTTKQVVLVEIPRVDASSELPINSVTHANLTHKIIDLIPAKELDPTENGQQSHEIQPSRSVEVPVSNTMSEAITSQ